MGAWGTGIFDDDTSLDLLPEIEQAANLREELERRLHGVVSGGKLRSDDPDYVAAFDALVPAAIIDAYVNGTHIEALGGLRERHPSATLQPLQALAAEAVARVIETDNELRRLWSESAQYAEWRTNLVDLRARLLRK